MNKLNRILNQTFKINKYKHIHKLICTEHNKNQTGSLLTIEF